MHIRWHNKYLPVLVSAIFILSIQRTQAQSVQKSEKVERIVIVIGASGQEKYKQKFDIWSARWKEIAVHKQAEVTVIGETLDARKTDRELLIHELQRQDNQTSVTWLILIGHGTFDGKTARFNLRGPDLTAEQLKKSCAGIQHPLAVIHCFSASGPFLKLLSAENRVVIAATKNGNEYYFSQFGDFLSQAHSKKQTDLDQDGQISLLEAYLAACRDTESYYRQKGQLATEHALLDDNGDQRGTRSDQFDGLRRIPEPHSAINALPDGHRAHQFILFSPQPIKFFSSEQKKERDKLEIKILELKQQKDSFSSLDQYYQKLEPLMIQLAHIYCQADSNRNRTIYDPQVTPVNAKKTSK